ncbi:hypothetical protein [Streptomyces sp. NPDC101455]
MTLPLGVQSTEATTGTDLRAPLGTFRSKTSLCAEAYDTVE